MEAWWFAPSLNLRLACSPSLLVRLVAYPGKVGNYTKHDEPQGNQIFWEMDECISEVVKAMRVCIKDTGESEPFPANITADNAAEMIARGKYVLSQLGPG